MPKFLLFIASCLLLSVPAVSAPENGPVVEWVSKNSQVKPGSALTLAYRVTNPSASEIKLIPEPVLPDGIRLAIPPKMIVVSPGSVKVETLTLAIPQGYPGGKTTLLLNLRDPNGEGVIREIQTEILIETTDRLTLELIEISNPVMAGEEITASYLLKNNGNTKRRITINAFQCNIVTAPQLELLPGESSVIRTSVKTNKELTSVTTHSLSIQAVVSDDISVRDYQTVKIFPTVETREDAWFRYPVSMSARYLGRGRDNDLVSGYQFEASGSGFLDESQKHKLEFMARGPDNRDLSFLGLYDEYYLSYKNKYSATFIGDKNYLLTPLTENSRYGKGAEQVFTTGNGSRIGGFYVEPRFYRNINHEYAGFAEIMAGRGNSVGVNYLSKNMAVTGEDAELISVTAGIKPFSETLLDLEYSRGTLSGKTDDAYRIFIQTRQRFFTFSGNLINAGEYYPGYYTNSVFYYGNLYLRLTNHLSLNLVAREDFSRAATDTLLMTAPYSRMYQASVNYRLNSTTDFRAYYLNYNRQDRNVVKQFDYSTESVNLWFGQNFNSFSYQLGTELGKTENLLPALESENRITSYRLSMNMQYKPTYLISLQGFAYYSNVNSFIAAGQKDLYFGGSAHGQISRNLSTNIQVQNAYGIEDYYRNRNLFQLSLDYSFLKRHKITAQSYYTIFQRQVSNPDFSFSLAWTVKLGVPLKKQRELGAVRGKITQSDGQPAKGLVVFAGGSSAITRDNGEFYIGNLRPGEQQLIVDRSKLAINEIPDVKLPKPVTVTDGEETNIEIKIVKASAVSGRITIDDSQLPGGVVNNRKPSVGNLVVEIQGEEEQYRVLTVSDGSFRFSRLRPGNWTVILHRGNLDPRYIPVKEKYEIKLEEGDQEYLDIVVQARSRNIIFSETPVRITAGTDPAITVKQEEKTVKQTLAEGRGIWFGVQTGAFSRKPDLEPVLGPGFEPVIEFSSNGLYKYVSGSFPTLRDARRYAAAIQTIMPDAFVVAFEGQNQITLKEALDKMKQEP
jgi:hypothetical protein